MGQVQVDPEEVNGIAQLTRKVSARIGSDDALPAAQLSLASFGNFEEAQGLVTQHGNAHSVVSATLQGVREDLNGFAKNIEDAVGDLLSRDQLTQTLLRSSVAPFNPLAAGIGDYDVYNDLDEETLLGLGGVSATNHGDAARDEAINNGGDA